MAGEVKNTLKAFTPFYNTFSKLGNDLGIARSDLHTRIMKLAGLSAEKLDNTVSELLSVMADKAQKLNQAHVWEDMKEFLDGLGKLNQDIAEKLAGINQLSGNARHKEILKLFHSERVLALLSEYLKQYANMLNRPSKQEAINSIFERKAEALVAESRDASRQTIYDTHTWLVREIIDLFFECVDAMLIEADLLPPSYANKGKVEQEDRPFIPMPSG